VRYLERQDRTGHRSHRTPVSRRRPSSGSATPLVQVDATPGTTSEVRVRNVPSRWTRSDPESRQPPAMRQSGVRAGRSGGRCHAGTGVTRRRAGGRPGA
jgi:hypothetical protein